MANRTIETHQQWIGYLNPTGLVFSPQALEDAQVIIQEGVISEQREFSGLVTKTESEEIKFSGYANVKDIFLKTLGWRETDLNSDQALITQYSFSHPQFNELVSPSYVSKVNAEKFILIQELDLEDFDKTANSEDTWNSSPHFKFERLLREKQTYTGILVSKEKLRLIFAPRGESSGYIDFPFKIMHQPSGRLVFSAFLSLFNATRVFDSQVGESLIEVLEKSRKYQAQVSIELSGQVLAALYELLRGFQTADDEESGELLKKTLSENPQLIYEGLLTTLLRMVFIMYAEDRNLLATDEVYQSSYSLAGLYERLRQDEAQNPDTMDSRYGAWAHLISLFRLIYDGAEYDSEKGKVVLPARHGHLFDPNIYLFLEGRDVKEQTYNKAPKISDGVVFRVLKNLLVLNGERISYRTLDVEQIGSVYETMMGFELGKAIGETIALKPSKSHGAPLPINLDTILSAGKDKVKKLTELSELKLTKKAEEEFKACKTIEELESALDKRIDRRATPFRLSKDAMVLVPSEARRKSGSHYTPRELTEPIVRDAFAPIMKNLGNKPTPEQILDIKICDPAMGSGAFLVEACRQLSEKLVESWATHKVKIAISADEDELLHARRLIAQKCLYGVDRNHMAVNLAKLSLWLVTLAKDHSFSFLDHNLKHGDSLLGLTNKQIMAFDYADREELPLFQYVKDQLNEALEAREEIIHATDEQNYEALKEIEEEYLERLEPLRLVGNLALKCFFDGKNEKERSKNIQKHSLTISNYFSANALDNLKEYCSEHLNILNEKLVPFHWELEFPEVFNRENSGFDCFVGNPPFLGGTRISTSLGMIYFSWLTHTYPPAGHLCDLVAYFFRRCWNLLNEKGTLGLIATNTISQGDTRNGGLLQICIEGGCIYSATKKLKWPGIASVMVSVIHISKTQVSPKLLNRKIVPVISPFLIANNIVENPHKLAGRNDLFSAGSKIYGQGFLFDDGDEKANPISLMNEVISKDHNKTRIFPYIGGEEVNKSFNPSPERWVIYLSDIQHEEELAKWPELAAIVRDKVKPERDKLGSNPNNTPLKKKWWAYQAHRPDLYEKLSKMSKAMVISQTSKYPIFTFIPTNYIFSQKLNVFLLESFSSFAVMQSRVHELWSLFFGSTLEDRPVYTPTDCFETFPFPNGVESNLSLSAKGEEYFLFRAEVMNKKELGLTKLYNRFHDPDDRDEEIEKLRELHANMDEEVIKSYGWTDLILEYDYISEDENDDDDTAEEVSSSRQTSKKYRLKFTDSIHEELLSRLMALNQQRYEEEVHLGLRKR